jgi:hypothetical protein
VKSIGKFMEKAPVDLFDRGFFGAKGKLSGSPGMGLGSFPKVALAQWKTFKKPRDGRSELPESC